MTRFLTRASFLTVSVAASLAFAASARADSYTIDPAHSSVTFKVKHLFSYVDGRFNEFSGGFDFDEAASKGSNLDVKIEAKSVNTDNAKRDDHLRSPDFFDVAKFKELKFQSKTVTVTGKAVKIAGELTMHGVTKPVTLDGEFLGQGKTPMGDTRAGFKASAKLNRKDYGIVWNKTLDAGGLMLGEDVDVELLVEAVNTTKSAKK